MSKMASKMTVIANQYCAMLRYLSESSAQPVACCFQHIMIQTHKPKGAIMGQLKEGEEIADRRMLSTGDIAKDLQVSPRTVAIWCDTGKLRCMRVSINDLGSKDKGHRRVSAADYLAFKKTYGYSNSTTFSNRRVLVFGSSDRAAIIAEALAGLGLEVRSAEDEFTLGKESQYCGVVILDLAEGIRRCNKLQVAVLDVNPSAKVAALTVEGAGQEEIKNFDWIISGPPQAAAIEIANTLLKESVTLGIAKKKPRGRTAK